MAEDQTRPVPSRRRDVGGSPAEAAAAETVEQLIAETHLLVQVPENCAPFTLEGIEYAPDEKGHVLVPAELVERLHPFGFKVA